MAKISKESAPLPDADKRSGYYTAKIDEDELVTDPYADRFGVRTSWSLESAPKGSRSVSPLNTPKTPADELQAQIENAFATPDEKARLAKARERESISTEIAQSFLQDFSKKFRQQAMQANHCFRTEVRDSGFFVCGVHRDKQWFGEKSDCPDVVATSKFAFEVLAELAPSYVDKAALKDEDESNEFVEDESSGLEVWKHLRIIKGGKS